MTTNEIPGHEIGEVYGEVFDTPERGKMWTEICAYGTAVRVRKTSP